MYLYDATTDAEIIREEYDMPGHNIHMVCDLEEEENAEISDLINMGVFKLTNGNASKRLRMRQETRVLIKTSTTAKITLKQIATQEFQAEKNKIQIQKQMIMQEVA